MVFPHATCTSATLEIMPQTAFFYIMHVTTCIVQNGHCFFLCIPLFKFCVPLGKVCVKLVSLCVKFLSLCVTVTILFCLLCVFVISFVMWCDVFNSSTAFNNCARISRTAGQNTQCLIIAIIPHGWVESTTTSSIFVTRQAKRWLNA